MNPVSKKYTSSLKLLRVSRLNQGLLKILKRKITIMLRIKKLTHDKHFEGECTMHKKDLKFALVVELNLYGHQAVRLM